MSTLIEVKNLSFTYPGTKIPALNSLNLTINKGEFILICGSSGSGKTTLAKCLNGIIPHLANGEMRGDVFIEGKSTYDMEMKDMAKHIGMVFQNPEDQIFSIRVDDEVAFGVECQGYKRDEIVRRTNYALDKLRIADIKRHMTFALSGGQKQKVSIASNLAMLPSVIVLDDPTTDLDPISKQEVMDILIELKNEIETTFVVIEHELTDLMPYVDRVIVMHEGKVILNGDPAEIFYNDYDVLEKIGVRIPDQIRLAKFMFSRKLLPEETPYPLKISEVELLAAEVLKQHPDAFKMLKLKDYQLKSDQEVATVKDCCFTYPGCDNQILFNINLSVFKGEYFAIIGHNGSGKSTLMKNILGLERPTSGEVTINRKNTVTTDIEELILDIGYVFQNPDNQLFCNSVYEEIQFSLVNRDFPKDQIERETEKALKIVGLETRRNDHPFSLSRGQRQRLAVATMMVSNPRIIMLDEPTTGLDEVNLAELLSLMNDIVENYGGTLIMVTHDMEVVAKYASRVIVIDKGRIALEGDPIEVFNGHADDLKDLKLKPTTISQISSNLASKGMPYIPYWAVFKEQVIDGN